MGMQAREVEKRLSLGSNTSQVISLLVTTTLCVPKPVGSKDNNSFRSIKARFPNSEVRKYLYTFKTMTRIRIICALVIGQHQFFAEKNLFVLFRFVALVSSQIQQKNKQFWARTYVAGVSTWEMNRMNQSINRCCEFLAYESNKSTNHSNRVTWRSF